MRLDRKQRILFYINWCLFYFLVLLGIEVCCLLHEIIFYGLNVKSLTSPFVHIMLVILLMYGIDHIFDTYTENRASKGL